MSEWNYSRLGHLINIDVVVIIHSMALIVAPQHWSIVDVPRLVTAKVREIQYMHAYTLIVLTHHSTGLM
jgi:hypothetical protein